MLGEDGVGARPGGEGTPDRPGDGGGDHPGRRRGGRARRGAEADRPRRVPGTVFNVVGC